MHFYSPLLWFILAWAQSTACHRRTYSLASVIEKRKWLYGHADKLFNLYVAGSVTELSDAQKDMGKSKSVEAKLPCRSLGCLRVFHYSKCRVNHEKSCHNLNCDLATDIVTDHVKSGDHIFNYGCLHITAN